MTSADIHTPRVILRYLVLHYVELGTKEVHHVEPLESPIQVLEEDHTFDQSYHYNSLTEVYTHPRVLMFSVDLLHVFVCGKRLVIIFRDTVPLK
jgi:hypothetical protein